MPKLTLKDAFDHNRTEPHRTDLHEVSVCTDAAESAIASAYRALRAPAPDTKTAGEHIDRALVALLQAHAHVTGDSTEITIHRLLAAVGLTAEQVAAVYNVCEPWTRA